MGLLERENPAHPDQIVGSVETSSPADVDAAVRAADAAQRAWAQVPLDDRCAALLAAVGARRRRARAAGHPARPRDGQAAGRLPRRDRLRRAVRALRRRPRAARPARRGGRRRRRRGWCCRRPRTAWSRRSPRGTRRSSCRCSRSPRRWPPATPSSSSRRRWRPWRSPRCCRASPPGCPTGCSPSSTATPRPGAALVGHPLVRKVAFTGGGATAQAIGRTAAEMITPTVMELGGNDPAIFLDDAALTPAAMQRAVLATFSTSGQVCMAAKRFYVHRSLHDAFVEAYVEAAREVLLTGDPLADGVTMGPVVSRAAQERLRDLLFGSVMVGGQAIEVGRVDDEALVDGDGYFVRPHVVTGLPDSARLVAEEQFGPIVPIVAFDTDDEVIARANAGDLGLGASVWSADEERAFAVARRIEAGFRFINTHNRTGPGPAGPLRRGQAVRLRPRVRRRGPGRVRPDLRHQRPGGLPPRGRGRRDRHRRRRLPHRLTSRSRQRGPGRARWGLPLAPPSREPRRGSAPGRRSTQHRSRGWAASPWDAPPSREPRATGAAVACGQPPSAARVRRAAPQPSRQPRGRPGPAAARIRSRGYAQGLSPGCGRHGASRPNPVDSQRFSGDEHSVKKILKEVCENPLRTPPGGSTNCPTSSPRAGPEGATRRDLPEERRPNGERRTTPRTGPQGTGRGAEGDNSAGRTDREVAATAGASGQPEDPRRAHCRSASRQDRATGDHRGSVAKGEAPRTHTSRGLRLAGARVQGAPPTTRFAAGAPWWLVESP